MDKIYEILHRNEWYRYENKNNDFMGEIKGFYNFPNDYLEFIKLNNCGEGYIGENYLYLWKIEDIEQLNKDYKIQIYLGKNCYGFGTDGGDSCFCFDNKNGNKIIKCGLGDLDYNGIEIIAATFFDLIEKMDKEII
jgi:hypothetical protein